MIKPIDDPVYCMVKKSFFYLISALIGQSLIAGSLLISDHFILKRIVDEVEIMKPRVESMWWRQKQDDRSLSELKAPVK